MARAGRRQANQGWLAEHFDDEFVKRARKEGYRSRAAFKLMELDRRDHLFRPGMRVVDLGAAPGGWSQYACRRLGGRGLVVAVDRVPIEPLPGVMFIQGDFTAPAVVKGVVERLEGKAVDLVMSDLAPNISGIGATDQARAIDLEKAALDFARRVLGGGGRLVLKTFQGRGFDGLRKELATAFERVVVRKPRASRSRSREVYLLGIDFIAKPRGGGATD